MALLVDRSPACLNVVLMWSIIAWRVDSIIWPVCGNRVNTNHELLSLHEFRHSALLMCCWVLLYQFPHEFISRQKTQRIYSFASYNLTELHLPPLTSSVLRRQAEARLMALRGEKPVQDQKALPHWSCADSVSECECHVLLTPVL